MKAPPDTRSLLLEWKKLDIGKMESSVRSGSNLQLGLPTKFHRTVFSVHEEMGHLGVKRVLQCLARERFFWPHMKRDIEHYVTRVCSCLKQPRPHTFNQEHQWKIFTVLRHLSLCQSALFTWKSAI